MAAGGCSETSPATFTKPSVLAVGREKKRQRLVPWIYIAWDWRKKVRVCGFFLRKQQRFNSLPLREGIWQHRGSNVCLCLVTLWNWPRAEKKSTRSLLGASTRSHLLGIILVVVLKYRSSSEGFAGYLSRVVNIWWPTSKRSPWKSPQAIKKFALLYAHQGYT